MEEEDRTQLLIPAAPHTTPPINHSTNSLYISQTTTTEQELFSIPAEEPPSCCNSKFVLISQLFIEFCWCLCCIPYYTFCCCFCWKQKEFSHNKPQFVDQFTRWIPSVAQSPVNKDEDQDPIPSLIKLYSDNPAAMAELQGCRINPNMQSKQRRDLEFFIP